MSRVFLSYAHRDSELASAVASALRGDGFEVFDPGRDIAAGESWRDGVMAAIAAADVLVVVVGSPEAIASSWVAYETGVADARGMPIIVLASDQFPADLLPSDLVGYTIAPLDSDRPQDAAAYVRRELKATA